MNYLNKHQEWKTFIQPEKKIKLKKKIFGVTNSFQGET